MSNPPRDDRTRYAPSSNDIQPTGSKAPGDFAVGEVIAGSYKVLSFIGRGGMGAVYRVKHLFLDKEMALKTLSGDQITEVAWKRFQIEGQAIARLDHQNIIRIYDLGIANGTQPYYAMELVDGMTLGQMLHQQGALPVNFTLRIFRQVAAGLAYAHERGIIHRDLKPVNIMLLPSEKADVPIAKVLDFGLAKLTDLAGGAGGGLTRTGEIFGSPLYMSPEQAQGLPVGPATDIYSFGCSIFEALTGEVPLKGGNALETMLMHQSKAPPRLGEIRPDLEFSPELEKFVARLLAKKPADRYQSFAEIAGQLLLLERPQTGMRTAALPQTWIEKVKDDYSGDYTDPPRPGLTTKPWFWPTVIAGTIVLLGGIGFITYQAVKPREVARPAYSPPQPTTAESGSPPKQIDVVQSFSHEEVIDGRKVKVFNFPENSDLGLLSYDLGQQDLEQKSAEWKITHSEGEHNPFSSGIRARGRQIIDPAYPLVFTPDEQTCNTPAVFKLFKADDLYKLDLTGNEYVNSDFLPFIKHLKGLRELFLDDTTVDDKGLKVIDGLSNLEFLRIDHTKISGTALAQSKVLSHVSRLSFSDGQDASSVIEAIKNYKNITELRLDKCVLTKHDLELLSAMPALVKLDVNDAGVGDDGLKILAKSKTLARLAIRDEKVTSASMSTLINMHLQKLTLLAQNWSAEDQEKLKAALSKPPRHCHLEFKSFGI